MLFCMDSALWLKFDSPVAIARQRNKLLKVMSYAHENYATDIVVC